MAYLFLDGVSSFPFVKRSSQSLAGRRRFLPDLPHEFVGVGGSMNRCWNWEMHSLARTLSSGALEAIAPD